MTTTRPIDTSTGLQAGSQAHAERVPVLVGWLVTLPDGFQSRMGLDKARADHYAAQQHGVIEPMFVWRPTGG